MTRLTKEQRRIYRNDLIPCKCGNTDVFIAWKWVRGCPNVRHYSVVWSVGKFRTNGEKQKTGQLKHGTGGLSDMDIERLKELQSEGKQHSFYCPIKSDR